MKWTYILDRISSPSFWVSFGALVTAAGFQIAPDKWQAISMFAMGIGGFMGMMLKSTPATGSVTAETIATNAVTNNAIAPNAVSAESIAPNAVTPEAITPRAMNAIAEKVERK